MEDKPEIDLSETSGPGYRIIPNYPKPPEGWLKRRLRQWFEHVTALSERDMAALKEENARESIAWLEEKEAQAKREVDSEALLKKDRSGS